MSNIEEDIKIIESMMEEYENCSVLEIDMQVDITFRKKQAKAIEHILSELKKANKQLDLDYVDKNYIPVEKVKDLKESIILDNTIVGGRRNVKTLEYGIKLGKIKVCEELLKDK